MKKIALVGVSLLALGAGCGKKAPFAPLCGTNTQLTSGRAGGACPVQAFNDYSDPNYNSNSNNDSSSGTNTSGFTNERLLSAIGDALAGGNAGLHANSAGGNGSGSGTISAADWQQINNFVAGGGQFAGHQHFPIVAVGAGFGGGPHAKVFVTRPGMEPQLVFSEFVFDETMLSGVRVGLGDVNGDGSADLIAAAGPGGGPHIKVIDGRTGDTDNPAGSFFAYATQFAGGVYVEGADFDGDRRAEVITGAGSGGGPHIKVFKGSTIQGSAIPAEIASFWAFDENERAGVTVAAGDVDGDGTPEIIAGRASENDLGNTVRVFKYNGTGFEGMYEFETFLGLPKKGVHVAAGDVDGDGKADIIVGQVTGGSMVEVYSGANPSIRLNAFNAYQNFGGGVTVAAGFLQLVSTAQVITGASVGGGPHIALWNLLNDTIGSYQAWMAFDEAFRGGVYVAASLFL